MSVKVPIGKSKRGRTSRGGENIISKTIQKEPSDLAFLRRLGIDGRLFIREGNIVSPGEEVTFVVPSGTTLFINAVAGNNLSTAFGSFNIQFDGNTLETVAIAAQSRGGNSIPLFVMVGDGVKVARMIVDDSFGIGGCDCTMTGWLENTEKLGVVVLTS